MWRETWKKLAVLLLASVLLAAPALAAPDAGSAPETWWQLSLERVVHWLQGFVASVGELSTAGDDGEPDLAPEGPQTLEEPDPNADSSDGNTYPVLDPDG